MNWRVPGTSRGGTSTRLSPKGLSTSTSASQIPGPSNLTRASYLSGSAVARIALNEGLIADEGQLIRPAFYLAESVRDWLVDYLRAEVAQRPRWNLL